MGQAINASCRGQSRNLFVHKRRHRGSQVSRRWRRPAMLRWREMAARPGHRRQENAPAGKHKGAFVKITWKTIAPLGIWLAIYLVPVPAGLNASQWHYFSLVT